MQRVYKHGRQDPEAKRDGVVNLPWYSFSVVSGENKESTNDHQSREKTLHRNHPSRRVLLPYDNDTKQPQASYTRWQLWEWVIKSRPMTTTYSGYMIVVTPEEQNGLWGAEVWIRPILGSSGTLHDHWKTPGWVSKREAEEAGLRWAHVRIDRWIASGK